MALIPAQITTVVWDTVRGVLVVNVAASDAPPMPDDGFTYSTPTGTQLAFDVPVARRDVGPPTVTRMETSPDGFILTRLTWDGTAWGNPVRVDQNDQPIPAEDL